MNRKSPLRWLRAALIAGAVSPLAFAFAGSAKADIVWNCTTSPDSTSYSGPQAAVKVGNCTQILTGASTYTGGTTISAGTLQLGNRTTNGSVTGNVIDNATLAFAPQTDLTFGGVISGTGAVVVKTATSIPTGAVFLTAANTYTGGTTIEQNVSLYIGNGGTSGSITGDVNLDGTIVFARSDAFTFSGNISGSGHVTVTPGTLILTGTNTYSGNVFTGFITVLGNATLQIGNGGTTGSIDGNSGANIVGPGHVIFKRSDTYVFNNTIAGSGDVTIDGGTLVYQTHLNLNSYSGGTSVVHGGTLVLVDNFDAQLGLIFNGDPTTGHLTLDDGTLRISRSLSFDSRRQINLGAGGGTFDTNGSNLAAPHAIAGAGRLTKTGGGTLSLIAANTYSGGTAVNGGTIAITADNNLGAINGPLTFDGGTLAIGADVTLALQRSITLQSAGGAFDTGQHTLTIGQAITGPGSLTVLGQGTLVLGGTNTYSGGTNIAGGTLSFSADAQLGAAVGAVTLNGGTLRFNPSSPYYDSPSTRNFVIGPNGGTFVIPGPVNIDGKITGTGQLTLTGGSGLALVGDNTYSGGTIVHNDFLGIGFGGTTGSIVGNVALGVDSSHPALLAFQRSDDIVFSGNISGWGFVAQYLTGKLSLLGTNTFVGAVGIQQGNGTLAVAADANLGDVSNGVNLGTGATLQFLGSFSSARAIQLGVGNPGSSIIDTNGNTNTLSGVLSGNGLTKAGAGTLILTAANTYSGPTVVNAGVLVVNGSIANSTVTVNGGTVKGSGTLGSVNLASGAHIAPGNSIGTININGDLTFAANSTYDVEVDPQGGSDRINVTGAAVVTGGKVAVTAASGLYTGQSYRILSAAGGVTGTFSGITTSTPTLLARLVYGATSVDLTLLNDIDFAPLVHTANQASTAAAVKGGGSNSALYGAFLMQQPQTAFIPVALDQLSGDIYPSLRTAMLRDGRDARQTMLDHMRSGSGADLGRITVWLHGLSSWGTIDSDGNAAGLRQSSSGVFGGADYELADNVRLGIAGGYTQSDINTDGKAARARLSDGHIAGYADWNGGGFAARFGIDHDWGHASVLRSIQFPGFADSTSARHSEELTQVFGEAGYGFGIDTLSLEPFAGLRWMEADTGPFAETGGAAALSARAAALSGTFSSLGLHLAVDGIGNEDLTIAPYATAAWEHAFGSNPPQEILTFTATSQNFAVAGIPVDADSAAIEAGFGIAITPHGRLGISYDGLLGGGAQSHAVRADLAWTF